jgi:hypothetical protein
MNREEQIMDKFKDFTCGFRILVLTHRGKEGGPGRDRLGKNNRKISRNPEEFKSALISLLKEKGKDMRIYSSVNERDFNKAVRNFKFKMLEADYFDQESKERFYVDIRNRWIGSLAEPTSRKETKFLIDIDEEDNEEDIKEQLKKVEVKILFEYPTKNGKHIITKPFNPNEVKAEIKKDAMVLLDY